MEVDLAVLADAANLTANGRLNILGIFDNVTLGPEFPATSPSFSIIIRLIAHPSELGKHKLLLRIADADVKHERKVALKVLKPIIWPQKGVLVPGLLHYPIFTG